MSNKTKDKIVFRDLARKFEWFTDEIGDMEVQSIIIPDDLPKIIEVFARYYFNIEGVSIISYLNAIQGAFLNIRDKTLHYNSIV